MASISCQATITVLDPHQNFLQAYNNLNSYHCTTLFATLSKMYSGLPIYFFLAIGFSAQLAITQNVCDIKAPPNNFEHATCNKHQARCVEEKGNLLERLSRSKGTWEARHPRYRLLDALHGFLKYSELVSKDVDRWRTMYKNVPKHQRKV